jgi:uncharacterized protein
MLYRFELANYGSFRDAQVIDLLVDTKVPDDDERFAPLFPGSMLRAPKIVAIYGANASGKTTALRALAFVLGFIRSSVQNGRPGIPCCERFNDEESATRPVSVAIEFGAADEPGLYRYELTVGMGEGAAAARVGLERLRFKPQGRGRWQRVFERDGDGDVNGSQWFGVAGYQHLVKTLAVNHSVISSFAKFQHPAAQRFAAIADDAYGSDEPIAGIADAQVARMVGADPDLLDRLNRELSRIDLGIERAWVLLGVNGPELMFHHRGLGADMPWRLQSHGTRSFVKLFPLLSAAIARNGIAVIDELDAALHPFLVPEIIRQFRASESAQLWFSGHAASVLDELTKEEIVLCEKDRQGRSRAYSLMDVQVRRDENHRRKYLGGAYGGVPHIG